MVGIGEAQELRSSRQKADGKRPMPFTTVVAVTAALLLLVGVLTTIGGALQYFSGAYYDNSAFFTLAAGLSCVASGGAFGVLSEMSTTLIEIRDRLIQPEA